MQFELKIFFTPIYIYPRQYTYIRVCNLDYHWQGNLSQHNSHIFHRVPSIMLLWMQRHTDASWPATACSGGATWCITSYYILAMCSFYGQVLVFLKGYGYPD